MLKLKQGTAAIVLVATLGLIVPGSFGGPASADVNNSRGHNPNMDYPDPEDPSIGTYVFHCDLDADGDFDDAEYELDSTFSAMARHVQGSNLVVMRRLKVDVLSSDYTVVEPDPDGLAFSFLDDDPEWFVPDDYRQGGGKPKGWQTVRCWSTSEDTFTANSDDASLEPRLIEGATYHVVDKNVYDVTLSQGGQRVAADSLDDSPSADRAHKAKKQDKHKKGGKHRGKGKRGR